jgi:hypothetical protein
MSKIEDFKITLVEYIGKGGNVVIPDNVTYIGEYAFDGCEDLTELIISDQVKDIAYTAFWNCDNLEYIKIGAGLAKISKYGLIGDCHKFKRFEVCEENEKFKAVDGNLYTKEDDLLYYAIGKKEESFTVPCGVRNIGPFAFFSCKYLKSVIIPEGVKKIGQSAFEFVELNEIILPKSINEIGESAIEKGTVIKAPQGSYAIEWAKQNNIKYEEI